MKTFGQFVDITWQSPSNIALIKYWGKKGHQLPINPSLSMTLANSFTTTRLKLTRNVSPANEFHLIFRFNGQPNDSFASKVSKYLQSLHDELTFLKGSEIEIESSNTFPHSAGIASSASSMSALALCLASSEMVFQGRTKSKDTFYHRASYLARLGSGSASRSIYGGFVSWGTIKDIPESNNKVASPLPIQIHPMFYGLKDSILIVSSAKKDVSSSAGHESMVEHPFRKARIAQANRNIQQLIGALSDGNWPLFSQVTENEALTLHALMMSANNGFILLQPDTLAAIEKIRQFRNQTRARICFTIDAGPNLHLLYPLEDETSIKRFIMNDLMGFASNNYFIDDYMGYGPKQVF